MMQNTTREQLLKHRIKVISLTLLVVMASFVGAIAFTSGTAVAASGEEIVDDFEDGDITVDAAGWSGWSKDETDGTMTATGSNAINGDYSGQISASNGNVAEYSVTRDAPLAAKNASTVWRSPSSTFGQSNGIQWRLYNGSNIVISIEFQGNGNIRAVDSGSFTSTGYSWSTSTIYNMRVRNIDYSNNTYEFYLNNDFVGEYGFNTASNGLDKEAFRAFVGADTTTWQFDDVGFDDVQNYQTVAGHLENTAGDRINKSGATVEVWGVRESAFDTEDAQKLKQESEALLEDASDVTPDAWDPTRDLAHEYKTTGEHYIVANSKTEWETGFLSSGVDPKPRLKFDDSETVTLSCWDPHDSADNRGEPVDGSWPGSTDSCTFQIERLSPTGEVLSSWTAETSPEYETFGASFSGFSKQHEVYQSNLASGFYRVSMVNKDSPHTVVFDVGDTEARAKVIKEDLEDEAGQRIAQAKEIQNLLDKNDLWRTTVTTDANGSWSTETPGDVTVVQVQAYDTPTGVPENATFSEVRDYLSATDVNQTSVLLSTNPERVSPPEENVTVTVIHADATQFKDNPEEWAKRMRELVNARLNESLTEMESFYQDRLENQTREILEQRFGDVRDLILANDDLREAYLELSEFEEVPEVDELSDEQARTEIRLMRQAFLSHDSRVPMEPPETDIGTDTISVEFPVAGEIEEASPEIVWSNGTVQNVSEDYWHVESGLLSSGSTLVIDDYPIGSEDAAVAKFRANVVTADGEVGRNGVSISNPRYTGDIPQINAIDVDALQPGADDTVTVRLRPEPGTGFEGVTGATAISPTNEDLETTITDSGAVQFSTSGAGYHFIRIEYEATGGDPFTLSFRLKARDHPRSETPTIQLVETPYGRTPVAGAGLESARYETDDTGQEHTFVAVTPSGDGRDVGKLEIRPGSKLSGTQNTINIALVEGEDEEAVNRHSRVLIHLPDGIGTPSGKLLTESMVRANGNPVTSEGTLQGEITDRDGNKQTLEVITDDSGQATIEVDEDPGWGDRPWWWISTNLPSFESPLTLGGIFGAAGDHAPSPASSGVGLLGLIGGAAAARRFQA